MIELHISQANNQLGSTRCCDLCTHTYNNSVDQVPMHHPARGDPIPYALQSGKTWSIPVSIVLEEEALHK